MQNSFSYFTSRFHQSASFKRPLFFRVCCAALQISTARMRGILNITHSLTIIFLYTVTPSTRIHEFLAFAAFSKDYICLISFIYNIIRYTGINCLANQTLLTMARSHLQDCHNDNDNKNKMIQLHFSSNTLIDSQIVLQGYQNENISLLIDVTFVSGQRWRTGQINLTTSPFYIKCND